MQQRLQLGRERQPTGDASPVQRLDPEAVPREHEAALARVPDRHREHATQPFRELNSVLLVEVNEHLGVRVVRAHAVTLALELGAQLRVVVDLAVLDDPDRLVLVRDRLIAALEVDDRQPTRRERGGSVRDEAGGVRPAMNEAFVHDLERGDVRHVAARRHEPADAAHGRALAAPQDERDAVDDGLLQQPQAGDERGHEIQRQ